MTENTNNIEYIIRTFGLMCDVTRCTCCPLHNRNNGKKEPCSKFMRDYPREAIELILKWGKGNPVKTYGDYVREHFPNCTKKRDGVTPDVCPHYLFGLSAIECPTDSCPECKNDFYNREYKGGEET